MRKKAFHIFLLYLAYGIMLAHTLVPHHHHHDNHLESFASLFSNDHHHDHAHDNGGLHTFHGFDWHSHDDSEESSYQNHPPFSIYTKIFPVTNYYDTNVWEILSFDQFVVTVLPVGNRPKTYLNPLSLCAGLRGPPFFLS